KNFTTIFQLETKLKRLAILEERSRISREIHDGIGGTLSGLIIQTEFLLTIPIKNNIITQELKELKRTAEEAMDEMRCSISMMRNEFDLILQLQNCCEVFQARHKLRTHFAIEGTPATFSAEKQLTIFRIMQECLVNSSKHSGANSVDVQIKFSQNALKMNITDNGAGFNPKIIPQNHFGILNIKERAKKIGGDVEIQSTPGKGTCVSLTLND
ncbi:MAG: sensor histidine kinase, partial [bacterium]|nr:sensor histidine kinase [bacterium]